MIVEGKRVKTDENGKNWSSKQGFSMAFSKNPSIRASKPCWETIFKSNKQVTSKRVFVSTCVLSVGQSWGFSSAGWKRPQPVGIEMFWHLKASNSKLATCSILTSPPSAARPRNSSLWMFFTWVDCNLVPYQPFSTIHKRSILQHMVGVCWHWDSEQEKKTNRSLFASLQSLLAAQLFLLLKHSSTSFVFVFVFVFEASAQTFFNWFLKSRGYSSVEI